MSGPPLIRKHYEIESFPPYYSGDFYSRSYLYIKLENLTSAQPQSDFSWVVPFSNL